MKSSQVKWSEELYYWLDVKALVVEDNEVKSSEGKGRVILLTWCWNISGKIQWSQVKWSEGKSYTIDLMLKH